MALRYLVGLAMLAGALTPAMAGETATYGGVPDVELIYYDVTGQTSGEIRAAMDKARPTDMNDGRRVDALTRFNYTWRWPGHNGVCDLSQASVAFHASVTLPRLVNLSSLPADLQARWTRYLASVEEHEKGHLLNAWSRRDAVLTAIRAATCATATPTAQAILREVKDADIAYDRKTDHGRQQGAVFD
jgi:predicted secreted Zn-dependent protease